MAHEHSMFSTKSGIYLELARLMDYPLEKTGLLLAQNGGLNQLRALNDPVISEQLAGLTSSLKPTDREALQIEYTRLFVYRPVCAPHETAYRGDLKSHQLIQKLAACYQKAGLHCSETLSPDHISVELEFMQYLFYRQGNCAGSEATLWQEQTSAFMQDHLHRWVPDFCARLQEEAQRPFKHLAAVIDAVVKT